MKRLPFLSWLLVLAGCHPRPAEVSSSPARASCIVRDSLPARDTVTLAYTDSVRLANAPFARNAAEQTLFRHLADRLVWRDCNGNLQPGVALDWSRDSAGTSWTFVLDSLALRGTGISSQSFVAGWNARRTGGIYPWPHILEARTRGTFGLVVTLDTAIASLPEAFAHPALSVPRIPFQTGLQVRPSAGPLIELIHLVPANHAARPVIRFQVLRRGVDERDLLDLPPVNFVQSADILVTRSPVVVDYGLRKPGFRSVALPWDRTYVLVGEVGGLSGLGDSVAMRSSLARDVVRGESRAATGPFWWESSPCPGTTPLLPMGRLPQVAYPRGDPVAQALAERVVALDRAPLRAVAMDEDDFTASLAGGESKLYVVPLPRDAPLVCRDQPAWPSAAPAFPLVDTRATAVVGPRVPPFRIESDGIIRFEP